MLRKNKSKPISLGEILIEFVITKSLYKMQIRIQADEHNVGQTLKHGFKMQIKFT